MSAPQKKKQEVATSASANAGLPAHLQSLVAADAGKGVSTKAEDNIVPMVYILQTGSPQVNRNKPEFIEKAKSGDIWMRASPKPIIEGESGFIFQPCFFHKAWVEWKRPRGTGSFVTSHIERPAEAKEVPDPVNSKKMIWIMPNGNEVIETRYHSGFYYPEEGGMPVPYVIPFSSTGHTISRQWMFMMGQKMIGQDRAPSFAGLYRLKTREKTNAAGTWFLFDVADAGWVPTEEAYAHGRALYEAFASGEKTAEEPMADEGGSASGSAETM